jgi:hypothetical protein
LANDNPDYLHLTSNKISITCKTCGVKESFYSELSVGYFRLKHAGHDLVEESPRPKPRDGLEARSAPNKEPVEGSQEVRPGGGSEESREARKQGATGGKTTVQIEQVLVEARASPADGSPVIQVRGMEAEGKDSFVLLFKLEEAARMREFLGGGRYQDPAVDDLVYAWDPVEVHFDWNRNEKPVPPAAKEAEPRDEVFAPPADSVAASIESLAAEQPPAPERAPTPAPPPVPRRAQKPRRRRAKAPPRVETPPKERAEGQRVPPPNGTQEKKDEETLLLAKSSFVQEGEEYKREAIRISKILKAFRWNVEPVYTIGVMLDDNMSIETNKTEISGALLKQIERAGYKLSAVTATSGKPTAWFKRTSPELRPMTSPDSTRRLQGRVEELSKTLEEERKRAEEEKALWEERFLQLTKQAGSSGRDEPESGPEADSSSQTEPDVTS